MAIRAKPPAEITITPSLVRSLIEDQHDDLAHLTLTDAGEGWDNRLFRLGDDLAVRLPRRAISAALIEQEQQWLPQLSPLLPLPIPVPQRFGRPGCGYPWPWSITPWFSGECAQLAPPHDYESAAVSLGQFLRALHRPAPKDAPYSPWRSAPLADRTKELHVHVQQLEGIVDSAAILDFWARTSTARPWPGPPLWIHGDLHPGNLVVADGRLSAVIDFGDLAAGDPATDLSVMWMFLPPSARSTFLDAARSEFDAIDDDTLKRARGWALALGLAYLVSSDDDASLGKLSLTIIDAALNDD